MPTGYTAAVQDGTITELEPFALQLARGMGALVMMRDDPHDAPIPEKFEPSDYNAKRLEEAKAERDRLYAMTSTEVQDAADVDYAEWVADKSKREQEHGHQRARYLAMIAKVEAWQGAPEGIKEFALEQLHRGLEFDCPEPFEYWRTAPPKDGGEWKREKLEKATQDILYHAKAHAEEEARTEGRNAWIAQLRKSLARDSDAGSAGDPQGLQPEGSAARAEGIAR